MSKYKITTDNSLEEFNRFLDHCVSSDNIFCEKETSTQYSGCTKYTFHSDLKLYVSKSNRIYLRKGRSEVSETTIPDLAKYHTKESGEINFHQLIQALSPYIGVELDLSLISVDYDPLPNIPESAYVPAGQSRPSREPLYQATEDGPPDVARSPVIQRDPNQGKGLEVSSLYADGGQDIAAQAAVPQAEPAYVPAGQSGPSREPLYQATEDGPPDVARSPVIQRDPNQGKGLEVSSLYADGEQDTAAQAAVPQADSTYAPTPAIQTEVKYEPVTGPGKPEAAPTYAAPGVKGNNAVPQAEQAYSQPSPDGPMETQPQAAAPAVIDSRLKNQVSGQQAAVGENYAGFENQKGIKPNSGDDPDLVDPDLYKLPQKKSVQGATTAGTTDNGVPDNGVPDIAAAQPTRSRSPRDPMPLPAAAQQPASPPRAPMPLPAASQPESPRDQMPLPAAAQLEDDQQSNVEEKQQKSLVESFERLLEAGQEYESASGKQRRMRGGIYGAVLGNFGNLLRGKPRRRPEIRAASAAAAENMTTASQSVLRYAPITNVSDLYESVDDEKGNQLYSNPAAAIKTTPEEFAEAFASFAEDIVRKKNPNVQTIAEMDVALFSVLHNSGLISVDGITKGANEAGREGYTNLALVALEERLGDISRETSAPDQSFTESPQILARELRARLTGERVIENAPDTSLMSFAQRFSQPEVQAKKQERKVTRVRQEATRAADTLTRAAAAVGVEVDNYTHHIPQDQRDLANRHSPRSSVPQVEPEYAAPEAQAAALALEGLLPGMTQPAQPAGPALPPPRPSKSAPPRVTVQQQPQSDPTYSAEVLQPEQSYAFNVPRHSAPPAANRSSSAAVAPQRAGAAVRQAWADPSEAIPQPTLAERPPATPPRSFSTGGDQGPLPPLPPKMTPSPPQDGEGPALPPKRTPSPRAAAPAGPELPPRGAPGRSPSPTQTSQVTGPGQLNKPASPDRL